MLLIPTPDWFKSLRRAETLLEALAGMAAISINNTALREGLETLESFIRLIAEAIDQNPHIQEGTVAEFL